MKLFIIRHGETADNAKRICQGHGGGSLSETGMKQAHLLGEWFDSVVLNAVYASDLERAVQTANEIVIRKEAVRLQQDQRIRERYFGSMQGKVFPKEFNWFAMPDDVESTSEMLERGRAFLADLKKKHRNESVAVVSHGGMILALLLAILQMPESEYLKYKGIRNTAVFCFDFADDGTVETILFNETPHLNSGNNEGKLPENC